VLLEPARPLEISRSEWRDLRDRAVETPVITNTTNGGSNAADDEGSGGSSNGGRIGPRIRALIGGILGLLFAIGLVLAIDRFDTKLRNKDEVEEAARLPVIAEIPPLTKAQRKQTLVTTRESPRSPVAEGYRGLRTALLYLGGGESPPDSNGNGAAGNGGNGGSPGNGDNGGPAGPLRPWLQRNEDEALVLLITSPGPDEGKTTTVANLSAAFAEADMSVLVLNCDYRRPRLHYYMEEGGIITPAQVAESTTFGGSSARAVKTVIPGVHMVTGIGEGDEELNPAQIAASLRRMVEVSRRHFDVVLLDTAPLLTTNDAAELLPDADLVLLVARYGRTKRDQIALASELLERLGAPVPGVVLIGSADAAKSHYYYYYHYSQDSGRTRKRKASIDLAEDPVFETTPPRPDPDGPTKVPPTT
jgi:receptor protein-tyrosine kinase